METQPSHVKLYYEKYGMEHDLLLRCNACRSLIVHKDITQNGSCACGNRRYVEVQALSFWEWVRVRLGIIDFAHRDEFLKEFSPKW